MLSHWSSAPLDARIRALFANGEAGAWYDPSDLGTLFQISNATTAVAVGDPVGYMADKSGNGKNQTQATAAKRPLLRTAGGVYYLEADGVNDFMASASAQWFPSKRGIMGVAYQLTAASDYGTIAAVGGAPATEWYAARTGTKYKWSDGTNYLSSGFAPVGFGVETIERDSDTSMALYVNGSTEALTSSNVQQASAALTLFANPGGNEVMTGYIAGFIALARTPTAAERSSIRRWLGVKCGVPQ